MEIALCVLGYNLTQFSEQDQINLLAEHWKEKGADVSRVEAVAQSCLTEFKMKQAHNEDVSSVTGTPLICYFLATTYEQDAFTICNNNDKLVSFRNMLDSTVVQIYTQYIDSINQREELSPTEFDQILDYHMEQAISFTLLNFDSKTTNIFTKHSKISYTNVLKCGILESQRFPEQIRFRYNPVAKYLAARAVVKIVKTLDSPIECEEFRTELRDYLVVLLEGTFSLRKTEVPLTNVCNQFPPLNIYEFQESGVCYFLNQYLKEKVNCEMVQNIFLQLYDGNEENLLRCVYKVAIASIRSNFKHLAKRLIEFYLYLLGKHANNESLLESKKVHNLFFAAAKYSSDSLKTLCNNLSGAVPNIKIKLNEKSEKCSCCDKDNTIVTLVHIAAEAGKVEGVMHLVQEKIYDIENECNNFSKIYKFISHNSISDTEHVTKKKIEILNFPDKTFHSLLLHRDHALLQRMPLPMLLAYMNIFERLHYFEPQLEPEANNNYDSLKSQGSSNDEDENAIITNDQGDNILHLLAGGHYDKQMTPEKYHNTLVEIGNILNLQSLLAARNNLGWSALEVAVSSMELLPETWEIFEKDMRVKFQEVDFRGNSILFKAVSGHRSTETLRHILKYVENWKRCNNLNENILHVAADYYNFEAVKYFVSKDSESTRKSKLIHQRDKDGNTPLHRCLMNEDKKGNISGEVSPTKYDEKTVLSSANYTAELAKGMKYYKAVVISEPSNQHKIIKHLIENGANIATKNDEGKTPLHLAIQICLGGLSERDSDKLNEVIRNDPDQIFLKNNTTLALKGLLLNTRLGSIWHPSLIFTFSHELVNNFNADIHRIEDGVSLLHLAARKHSFYGVVCLVKEHKFYHLITDKKGRTPLQFMKCCLAGCELLYCKEQREYLNNPSEYDLSNFIKW